MRIKLHAPGDNLGCLGITIGPTFYADLYSRGWLSLPGLFVRWGDVRWWIVPFHIRRDPAPGDGARRRWAR